MIAQDKIERLWGHLTNQFHVAVYSIGTGLDDNKQECAVVMIDNNTQSKIIATLPKTFEGEKVRYDLGGQPIAYNL